MRDQIVEFLRRELIGPDPITPDIQENGEEILKNDSPRIRYGAGVLFPRATTISEAPDPTKEETSDLPIDGPEMLPDVEIIGEDRATDDRGEESTPEDAIALTNAFLPSAMGVSCFIEVPEEGLQLEVQAARYHAEDRLYEFKGEKKRGRQYRREPISSSLYIAGMDLIGPENKIKSLTVQKNGIDCGLEVRIVSRPRGLSSSGRDRRLATFTVINSLPQDKGRVENDKCFFQVSMRLSCPTNHACFLEYPERGGESLDEEDESLRLLYRHKKTFAIGHGCAAEWIEQEGRASVINSEVMPVHEVKPIVPAQFKDLDLSMSILGDLNEKKTVTRVLSTLCEKYEAWIQDQEAQASHLDDVYKTAAKRHLNDCRACLQRMRRGIKALLSDSNAMLAFTLANRAMLLQQMHYSLPVREWKTGVGGVPGIDPVRFPDVSHPPDGKGTWRPFQLAFILINICSQVYPQDSERGIVDLIWFPTGGGKTEAYLGLTAFTIFLRRLRNPRNAGVTVLMRYTLRLLTAQQFQRAATLICACERIRRDCAPSLGEDLISIGLWVGQGLTPNRRTDALNALSKLTRKETRENPFVVLRCPWCSAQMGPVEIADRIRVQGYEKHRDPMTVRFRCPDKSCPFSGKTGLPLHVIDEDIYAQAPSLIIGTVDKFAMLPWRPEARSIFGLDDGEHAPPDLIIQDELHLISGPLGSMVGHYETAINEFCIFRDGDVLIVPKIIASTATIRRAHEQVKALYNREVFQFPPQGLRAGDSFFAEENENLPGRYYVGIHASALASHITAQVRVFAALLQAIKSASAGDEKARDPYFTLIGYFNSLRELGHAATLVRADIQEYLISMWSRRSTKGDERRFIYRALELTSRAPSTEIPESLKMLEHKFPAGNGERPVDVCLATNMISVGVDIPRLGLMAVVGQPKTTSEYIQATSRVGRSFDAPGLVVTIYHTAKSRDRSHYEHFRSYHSTLYQQVEPTSVTPFAPPVRDRALHAVLIALVRFLGNPSNQARPQPFPGNEIIQFIKKVIVDRVKGVDPEEEELTLRSLDDFLDRWKRVLPPRYGDFGPAQEEIPLMYPAGTYPLECWDGKSSSVPSSARSVDSSCEAAVISQYPGPTEE